jgi:predicted phage tail protein
VTLVWIPSPAGGAPAYYVIEAGSGPGFSNLANFSTGTAVPAFRAVGVPNGVYFVRVRAANAWGVSATSNEVVIVIGAPIATSRASR